MCPEFERVERVVQNDVMGPEIVGTLGIAITRTVVLKDV